MTKYVVVDSGSVISLSMTGMLDIFRELSGKTKFAISTEVHNELFKKPMAGIKFKFSAMRVEEYVQDGILEVIHNEQVDNLAEQILRHANSVFRAKGKDIKIIHRGEAQIFALAKHLKSDLIINDERVSRTFVEAPQHLQKKLLGRLHTEIGFNKKEYDRALDLIGELHIIRSADLFAVAFDRGVFNSSISKIKIPNAKAEFLRGGLWALKFSGCFISQQEIEEYVKMLV